MCMQLWSHSIESMSHDQGNMADQAFINGHDISMAITCGLECLKNNCLIITVWVLSVYLPGTGKIKLSVCKYFKQQCHLKQRYL